MLLGEGLEDVLFEVFPDADARILHDELVGRGPILEGGLLDLDKDGAVGPVVLEGVVDDVHEDLLQVQRVSDDPAVLQLHLLQHQMDAVFLRRGGEDGHAVFQDIVEVEGILHHRQAAALQLADLKHVVHQGQQMLRGHADLPPALPLPLLVLRAFLHDGKHAQDSVDRGAQVVGHVGEELAFGGVGPPDLLQKAHDGLLLLFPRHGDLRDILVVSEQADARLFKGLVGHAAAADIDFSQRRVVPGIDDLGAPGLRHLPHGLLHHLHIVRVHVFKPVAVARLRLDVLRHAQEDAHGPVRVHPGLPALLQLDGPDARPGALQNVLQALPGLQLVLLLLLHQGVDVPQGEDGAVLLLRSLRGGEMELHVLQAGGASVHLVADGERFLGPELGEHAASFRRGPEPLLIPGDHILGDVPLHGRLIALLEMGGPVHAGLPAAAVDLARAGVQVHLEDAQVVHAEGVKDVVAPVLEHAEEVAPLQGGHDEIRRGLQHIGRVFQRLHRGVVHAVKADQPFAVVKGDHHQGADALPVQGLKEEGVGLPDIFQVVDDDVPADAEVPVPAGAHLWGDVLQAVLLRSHSFGHPLIGVVVAAGLVFLEDIGPSPAQGPAQVLQQHLQRLVRGLLPQGDTEALVDDGLQVLNAPDAAGLLKVPGSRRARLFRIVHTPILQTVPWSIRDP